MRAWKQVDLRDAHYAWEGRLKLGRLEDYANLENGRADARDGGLLVHSGTLFGERPDDLAIMKRLGWTAQVMQGNRFITSPPKIYAYCTSEVGCTHDPSPSIPKATFEISDLHTLGNILLLKYGSRLLPGAFGPVIYERREVMAKETYSPADPFIKDVEFAEECEIRSIFFPQPGAPFETLYTDADPDIAGLFKRIM